MRHLQPPPDYVLLERSVMSKWSGLGRYPHEHALRSATDAAGWRCQHKSGCRPCLCTAVCRSSRSRLVTQQRARRGVPETSHCLEVRQHCSVFLLVLLKKVPGRINKHRWAVPEHAQSTLRDSFDSLRRPHALPAPHGILVDVHSRRTEPCHF